MTERDGGRHQGLFPFIFERRKEFVKKQGCLGTLFDFVMTIATGGLWLIWVLIRYLRTH